MNKKFYITTAIPYVNAAPHIGHALEFVQADAIARFEKLQGKEVRLLSGADENALKNVHAAEEAHVPVQEFVDQYATKFEELAKTLDIKFDIFQKGSNQKQHFPSSQKLWELCAKHGDIYKKEYEGLYCVGCEAFYTPDELNEKGECFEHPGKKLEKVKETNYFFKLSKYHKHIVELISTDTLKIYPESRKNEVLGFLKQPLHDISISRTNERAKNWGVPVPGDDTQRMYVWFDALNIYQSGVGYGWDEAQYKKWWPADMHAIGKGIIRFHAVYWPAFLISASLELPKALFVHGYITANGQKMSKTLGNVIDPFALVKQWGVDAVRYYLLREISPFDDGDFSDTRMLEIYNSELANELGNLVVRITTIAEKDGIVINDDKKITLEPEFVKLFESYELNKAVERVWYHLKRLNREIDEFVPWKKTPDERKDFLIATIIKIRIAAYHLEPFLPQTSAKIIASTKGKISKAAVLFPKP